MGGTANGASEVLDLAGVAWLASGARADGFVQDQTGLGDRTRDRSKAYHYDPEAYDYAEIREQWRGDPLIAAFVEKPPKAMFRRGFEVHTDSRDIDDHVRRRLDELQVVVALRRAAEFSRAYRGGGVYLRFDDADSPQRLAMPVRPGARLLEAKAYDEKELWAQAPYWERDPLSPRFGQPSLWRWTPYVSMGEQLWVHPSRLLILSGPEVSNIDRWSHAGWGNSRAHRVLQATADFYASARAILLTLQSNDLFALGMKNYTQLMAREDGKALILQYVRNIGRARSNAGALLYDSDLEKPERLAGSLQGIADGLRSAEETLSATYQMPLSEIFGTEPPGLNADGSTSQERYDDSNGDAQRDLTPQVQQVARHLVAEKDPAYAGTVSIAWAPLRQPTESQVEDVRIKVAQRDQIYVAMGVVSKEEIRQSRFGGERYSAETRLDKDPATPGVQVAAPGQAPSAPSAPPAPVVIAEAA